MRAWSLGACCIAVVMCGCGKPPAQTTVTPDVPKVDPNAGPPVPKAEPFDETKGYLHKPSGVGFVSPDGWEKTPMRSEAGITSFGFNKDTPRITVSLYWTVSEESLDGAAVGEYEYEALSQLYGPKISKPQPVQVSGRSGFKLSIDGAPLGQKETGAAGVVYVFGVRKDGQWWKIKMRATVTGRENLAIVEPLLQNYRW